MGTEIKKEFNDYDWSEAPNPELCNVASAQQKVYNMIVQGAFGNSTAEYIAAIFSSLLLMLPPDSSNGERCSSV